jgi:ribose transport system ATP-binding protein
MITATPAPEAARSTPLLSMTDITKRFPGVQALDHVSLDVEAGEVHAITGENGAGKSTLIRILGGIHERDGGEVVLRGHRVEISGPRQAREMGIAIIHQELSQVGPLSVAENLLLGREPRRWRWFMDWRAARAEARRAMADLGIEVEPGARVDLLSVAERQALEIARALSQDAGILVMDEPTAALTLEETNRLFDVIDDLKARGVAVIYISHRLEEVFRIADRVTVLRDGRHVATSRRDEIDLDTLIQQMVGRRVAEKYPKATPSPGATVLEVRDLGAAGRFRRITFSVRAGEIVGIAGLVGSGKIEVGHALFGAMPVDVGAILIDGKRVAVSSPRAAIHAGIGLVPEDRKTQGLVLGMSVRKNISLPFLGRLATAGFVRNEQERQVVDGRMSRLDIRASSPDQIVRTLSGGNQQKTVVAKWLETGGKVLVLCEPTRGVDVGAKVELYRLMSDLARAGVALVLISSELPEVIGMSDRILVMHEGEITGEFSRAEATQEAIMASATGRTYRRADHH